MSESTDTDVQRARDGDQSALARLLDRMQPRIRRAAPPLLGEALRARTRPSDIVQSTFLEVVASVGDFRGSTESDFERWVLRILQNNVRDARKYFNATKRSTNLEERGTDADSVESWFPSPSRAAAATEELVLLGKALGRLQPPARRILMMHMRPGFSHEAAARILGRTVGATRVMLARARAALALEMDRLRGRAPE